MILVITLFCFAFVLRNFFLLFLLFWATVFCVKDRDVGRLADRLEIELF